MIETPGNRLHAFMKMNNMTQEDLSRDLGLSRGHISHLCTDSHKIRKITALALLGLYNLNPNWLLYGRGVPKLKKLSYTA